MDEDWDVIVVGAGVMGSWAAYHLAKNNKKTLLLDQFYLPHNRGSSNGQTRIMRFFYDQDFYACMLDETKKLWTQLGKEGDTNVFIKTGLLAVQNGDTSKLLQSRDMLAQTNKPFQFYNARELRSFYPMLKFDDSFIGVLDEDAVMIFATKCLTTLQRLFLENGGKILDGHHVTNVKETTDGRVAVETQHGVYTGAKVVLTLGPWAKDLMAKTGFDVPLVTLTGHQYYFKTKNSSHDALRGMPMFIHWWTGKDHYQFVYSKPSAEYPGLVKVGTRGQPMMKPCHPDERDRGEHMEEFVCSYVKEHMPFLEEKPSIVDPCVYTMSPDSHYIIDRHPKLDNVFIGAGFSGHGFKLAPVVGKLLCEMVLSRPLSYDISRFKVTRFGKQVNSKI